MINWEAIAALGIATSTLVAFLATLVALFSPWVVRRLDRRSAPLTVLDAQQLDRNVSRVALQNTSSYTAMAVKAYVHEVRDDGMPRHFLPLPMRWTHSYVHDQPDSCDVHPTQTVHLDIFDYLPSHSAEEGVVHLAVNGGGKDEIIRIRAEITELLISLYQEDGQVTDIKLTITWKKQKTDSGEVVAHMRTGVPILACGW